MIAADSAEVTEDVLHFLKRSVVVSGAATMRLQVLRIREGIEHACTPGVPTQHPSAPLLGRTEDDHRWFVNCGQCSTLDSLKWWELGKAHRKATLHQLAASHPDVMSLMRD